MSISINGIEIAANEIQVNVSVSVETEAHPWLLRDQALNSRTTTGHKAIEVETLSGKRVLVQDPTGTYHDVPLNNNDILTSTDRIFKLIIVSISASAADATGLSDLMTAYKDSMEYYAKRKIILAKINDSYFSYDAKVGFLADLDALTQKGFSVTVPGLQLGMCNFTEGNGLNISYWTNGPYADLKATLVNRTRVNLKI